jgi:two-component system OmpR family response regulator
MTPKTQILIVDDDEDINRLLANYLLPYGIEAHAAGDGPGMRRQLERHKIELIVMDVMLPGADGLSLTREVRQHSQIPVIMLTARCDHFDRVLGLENGADDYITKPFEPRELVARIQSVLRRATLRGQPAERSGGDVIGFNGWRLDANNHSLCAPSGLNVMLSNAEFRLLSSFLRTPRRLLSRDQLVELAHGHVAGAGERSIDLLVSRLRQKLAGAPDGPEMIKTVRGRGYLFTAAVERGLAA